jgi:hypothetical protein
MKHTPTPWEFEDANGTCSIYSNQHPCKWEDKWGRERSTAKQVIAQTNKFFASENGATEDQKTSRANAERIIACVNACEGIHDPRELILGSEIALKENVELRSENQKLFELLKSLTCFAANDFRPGYGERSDDYTKAFHLAYGLVKHHCPEFDPFESCIGVRSNQEATVQLFENTQGGGR